MNLGIPGIDPTIKETPTVTKRKGRPPKDLQKYTLSSNDILPGYKERYVPEKDKPPKTGKKHYAKGDNLFGHLTVNENQGIETSRSFHQYKNSSNFDFEHSDDKSRRFRNEHNTRNVMAGFSKTISNFNDFSGFGQHVPKHVKQRDSTPGMRYFGMASGYSPLRRSIDKDYELSPDFVCKGRRPQGVKDAFSSSILI